MQYAMVLRRAMLPVLVLLGVLVPFFLFGDRIGYWTQASIEDADDPTVALLAIVLLAGDVFLPVPSSLVSLSVGGALGLWMGSAAIWTGMTLGCLVGWAAGRGLLAPVDRAMALQQNSQPTWGVWSLILFRPIPVLAELSVLVTAARGMGLGAHTLACGLANIPIAVIYAHFGAALLGDVPGALLFAAAVLVSAAALLFQRRTSVSRGAKGRKTRS